jgi:hypothetical protein
MPYAASSTLMANHAAVSGSAYASGNALCRNKASSSSLPAFGHSSASSPSDRLCG